MTTVNYSDDRYYTSSEEEREEGENKKDNKQPVKVTLREDKREESENSNDGRFTNSKIVHNPFDSSGSVQSYEGEFETQREGNHN